MEENKGFWYADWSFPIFVGLLSSGVFAGTHMYYLYGIGAFNEVAFVAMLKAGWIPASTARSPLSAPAFICPHYRRFAGRNSGYRRAIQTGVGLGFRRYCWGWLCLPGGELYRFADNRSGDWHGDWLHHYSGA